VVEEDVHPLVGVVGHDLVHELGELDPPAPLDQAPFALARADTASSVRRSPVVRTIAVASRTTMLTLQHGTQVYAGED
jgi:hypothetical protein